ncbi:hypothetical protein KC19_VG314100 [Ceratodon purpureus]|uniref:Reverse transcriptase zinc-binding domain-containing protein n=1 Tax=Ceratodon purpureus TaxID=3225 RepID=A0A8T0HW31_CERPU|nr:hypothetical protein KC19_VG314100 [Ceratodon purpureus]
MVIRNRERIINSIPWPPADLRPAKKHRWMGQVRADKIEMVYHLRFNLRRLHYADIYSILPSNQLLETSNAPQPIDTSNLQAIRTVLRNHKGKIIGYNPAQEMEKDTTIWLFGNKPTAWNWKALTKMKKIPFFHYEAKRGYAIGLMQKQAPMRLTIQLTELGYNSLEQTRIYQRIWHTWKPSKVAAMNWLTAGGGLPVGEWRKKIGDAGTYRMCNDNSDDTLQHSLVTCQHVKTTWDRYNDTRSALDSNLPPLVWPQHITGIIDPPGTPPAVDTFTWDSQGRTKIDMDTPWDILRSCLLRFIWCQRYRYELNNHPFHLGAALFNAWRTTIYIGMEAESEIVKYKKPERRQAMTHKLTEI